MPHHASRSRTGRTSRWLLFAIAAVALLATFSLLLGTPTGTDAATPQLDLKYPRSVKVGEPIAIELRVKDANGIAGYETTLRFDTQRAHLGGVTQRENDLRKLGRDVQALGPVESTGGVMLGAYSCPVSDCGDAQGKARKEQGGKGRIRLATITVVPDVAGTLDLTFEGLTFVDASGAVVAVTVPSRTIQVTVTEVVQ